MGNGNDGGGAGTIDDGITTSDGLRLEAELTAVDSPTAVAVVTHPHPLHGGEMHNPVPAGIARGLAEAGVAVLRFNFRGTGASEGHHGEGDAERTDVVAAIDAAAASAPGVPVVGVGYSFGADVLLATEDDRLAVVIAVAPPLRVLPDEALRAPRGRCPTVILSPEHDQFCDAHRAAAVTQGWPATTVEAVGGADHFLAGRLDRVVRRIRAVIDDL